MSVETLEVNTTNYTLEVTNGTTQTLEVTEGVTLDLLLSEMGLQGPAGPAGKNISSVVKTSTVGLVDTYTITFNDNTTQTFTVTNGTDGIDGIDGRGIVSITRTSGTGAAGTTDTYTIAYTDSTTSTFTVYNGADGVSSGGTVTSVELTVPAGLSVANSPITTSGTLAVTYSAGYSIPTTVKQGQWDTAYGWGNHASAGYSTLTLGSIAGAALAASGSSGSATTAAKSDHVHPFPTAANVGAVAASGGTASGLILNDGYTEEVFAVSGTTPALSPANGSIQTWTLTGNATPTAGTWASGQSIMLMIDDGSARTINWASLAVTWKTNGGSAPTLQTSGFTVIALWKVGTVIYGARVGDS